jgi:hypothetical protein
MTLIVEYYAQFELVGLAVSIKTLKIQFIVVLNIYMYIYTFRISQETHCVSSTNRY